MVDFNLDGVFEHKVQSDIIFKLRCTKNGQVADVDYPVEAILKGARDEIRGEVSYHFGTYTLKFYGRSVGMFEMHVKVKDQWLYRDGDVTVSVVDQLAKKYVDVIFELDGSVLQGNLRVGTPSDLVIYTKSSSGTAQDVEISEIEVRLGQGHSLQKMRPQRESTGVYSQLINVELPGFQVLDVFFEGKSVLKEPVRLQWVTATDPKNTKACQVPTNMVTVGQIASFYIQSRNKNDLNNTCGGDLYEVKCDGPIELTDLEIRDSSNGKYAVTFTPLASGLYQFHIALNGVAIGNSPVTISAVKR